MNDEQQVQGEDKQATQEQSLIMDNDVKQEPHPLADDTQEEDTAGTQDEQVEEVENQGVPQEQSAPAPQKPVEQPERLEDPGDFQPNDYSFDVNLADGTTIRIEKPEDMSKVPSDADFGTPKNFADVWANYSRMVNGVENDRKSYEEQKAAYDKQLEADQQLESRLQTMMSEFSYLESNGDLPAVPSQYENADWSDPEVAKQPGVKERIELLSLRKEENEKRTKAGLPPIGILETKTLMENRAFKEAASQREQKQNNLRKQRGAMVAGPSAPEPSKGNNDMIVGSGGSLRDLGY